jgi:hypothetical protein
MLLIFRSVHFAVAPIGAPPNEAQQRMSSSLSKGLSQQQKEHQQPGFTTKEKGWTMKQYQMYSYYIIAIHI